MARVHVLQQRVVCVPGCFVAENLQLIFCLILQRIPHATINLCLTCRLR